MGIRDTQIMEKLIRTINSRTWTNRGVDKIYYDKKTGIINEKDFTNSFTKYLSLKADSKQRQATKMSKIMKDKQLKKKGPAPAKK